MHYFLIITKDTECHTEHLPFRLEPDAPSAFVRTILTAGNAASVVGKEIYLILLLCHKEGALDFPRYNGVKVLMCPTILSTLGLLALTSLISGDLWTFRDLDFSRVVLSRPMIGPFATRYFSHLFDPSRFATSVTFAVCCQLNLNYSLNIMHSVIFSIS